MNVLVIGSGGREHAISWKLSQSDLLSKLFIAPGNPGTLSLGTNVPINPLDFVSVRQLIIEKNIDLVVVGPEDPLVRGIEDFLTSDPALANLKVIGPSMKGAQLEGSKRFAKEFMIKYGIPTAAFRSFDKGQRESAIDFLRQLQAPFVVKADGLAAGKGVAICPTVQEAAGVIDDFFAGKFGDASKTIVIEEFLRGIEVSVFVLTDGKSYVILPEAKDYKRIGENDTGPNTGGMGAVSPVPFATRQFIEKVENRIIKPTIKGIQLEGIRYKGFIFIGLMNVNGDPYVIEYNVRMGDPETQVVLPRIKGDFLKTLVNAADGKLEGCPIEHEKSWACTVILASEGYPGDYRKGEAITISGSKQNGQLFHAGTIIDNGGTLKTSGGRVIASTGFADSLNNAVENAYRIAGTVHFNGKYLRRDIGKDLLSLMENQ